MTDNNIIKSITAHVCPKCGEKVFAESQMLPPVVNSLFTESQVEEAKADCLKRIETISIGDERRAGVEAWLKDPNTIFGPSEVDAIILSLVSPEEKEEKKEEEKEEE